MPELIEVEYYAAALRAAIGTPIDGVATIDELVGGGTEASDAFVAAVNGAELASVWRHGKVLFAETSSDAVIWMRFGMTGRLVVGNDDPVPLLEYGPLTDDRQWDRLVLHLSDGREIRLNDARRFARVGVGADVGPLGVDAATLDADSLSVALRGRRAVKAVLLDQTRIAGLGNLLVDESLWRAGVDPSRPASSLDSAAVTDLASAIVEVVDDLSLRGGSHRGDLQSGRGGGDCPRDGAALRRSVVGGRTTWSCPVHQR